MIATIKIIIAARNPCQKANASGGTPSSRAIRWAEKKLPYINAPIKSINRGIVVLFLVGFIGLFIILVFENNCLFLRN